MVVEEVTPASAPPVKSPGVPQDQIDNIMGGISNTGSVRMNNHRRRLRQSFDIIKRLGQGTYGKVQLGINKETGQEVAIKTIKKCKIEAEADLIRIRREVQIMSSVQHPNIIHIYEVFESREKLILVMEFAAGGELYDYLSERKVLSEGEARRIFRQISTAVYYCHKHKICHRDLKLENILLDEHGNAKIADFGLSNVFDDRRLLSTFCGSPLYASPEIVKGTPYQGPEVDCWSLGVLLYTLVYGSMPFDGSNFKRLVKQISTGDYYEPKEPSPASPLIREMLTVCPIKRASIEQICSHWWVNEGYKESCLDLAEDLANQTPVRLDVLLSLSPAAITADQLVVPSSEAKTNERVPRSHSVGSIRDIAPQPTTEAERRILDMVAAGGEAALMPSPTRTITPTQSPVQPKRKLETTVSTDNAAGAIKKKERPAEQSRSNMTMEIDQSAEDNVMPSQAQEEEIEPNENENTTQEQQLDLVENMCDELMQQEITPVETKNKQEKPVSRQRTVTKLDAVKESTEEEVNPTKVIKKFVNKHKTADLVAAITSSPSENTTEQQQQRTTEPSRKSSLTDESGVKVPTERRRSRILETAEKFQNLTNANNDKQKKIVIPGVSVGNFKKEFERRASLTGVPSKPSKFSDEQSEITAETTKDGDNSSEAITGATTNTIENCDSKSSLVNFSLEEARRSMENSIALLNQAKDESTNEVEQLCAKTESVAVSDPTTNADRNKKLRAREIIGNAIQPGGRLCMGARKPPVPYGMNGRSVSGSVVPPPSNYSEKVVNRQASVGSEKEVPTTKAESPHSQQQGTVKTSKAEITLKSATLPRRKTAKAEIQLDIKPKIAEQPTMRFSTEMHHEIPDLRSAPIREGPSPYSPPVSNFHQRATSLEPQTREHFIPIQKPSVFTRANSNTLRSGSSSRQSTIESEGETTPSTVTSSQFSSTSQPIKKSPREFIIPIAVEGGGYLTPRSGSLEPSESNHTTATNSTFSHIGKPRRFGTLLSEMDSEEESPFQKLRINRDGQDDPRFTLHRLRSTRPVKKLSQDTNDSQSSGEDDDEDGFEILTAENLFSTLLQRVRALTNRLNVNNDIGSSFGNSRLLGNMRQPHSSFWNHDPFGRSQFSYSYKSETIERKQTSRLNNKTGNNSSTTTTGGPASAWRQNFSRDLNTDMDSMFTRPSATLPRGKSKSKNNRKTIPNKENNITDIVKEDDETLDLADLDLSRLRLTKKDLETLSTITPGLPKCFQEQLLAKLPPTQARKLSRTLSMQNNSLTAPYVNLYKRSLSGGRELNNENRNEKRNDTTTDSYWDNSKQSHQDDIVQQQQQQQHQKQKSSSNSRENSLDDRNNQSYRRSTSRSRCDETDSKSGSYRSSSECNKSFCIPYSTDISDKYKYYSPYLGKNNNSSNETVRQTSPYKRYDSSSISPITPPCLSPTKEVCGRPPSGCLSPPPINSDNLNRRRSSKRRFSRFLRQDIFDMPDTGAIADNAYLREKNLRERETQSVLREIREKSRERERNEERKRCKSVEKTLMYEKPLDYNNSSYIKSSSQIDKKLPLDSDRKINTRHVRNKSLERFCDLSEADNDHAEKARRRRSFSRPRELDDNNLDHINKCAIANQILEELQLLAAAKNKQLKDKSEIDSSNNYQTQKPEEKVKIKKSHSKEKSSKKSAERQSEEGNLKPSKNTKKEKKIEGTIDKNNEELKFDIVPSRSSTKSSEKLEKIKDSKKGSKLLRPKSYPSKEPASSMLPSNNIIETHEEKNSDAINSNEKITKESSIVRPKSYPNSKITPPKEIKKFTRSGPAISAVMDKLMEKSEKTLSKSLSSKNSQSPQKEVRFKSKKSSETEKKQKSEQELKTNKSFETFVDQEISKQQVETPSNKNQEKEKEKSPEKKSSKGLLYALGQKFEKLRENAKNKEKKSSSSKNIGSNLKDQEKVDDQATVLVQKASPNSKKKTKINTENAQNISPEKSEEKSSNKVDKKSRIDAMIKSLRDRSLTRAPVITESGLIKRAISVENLPGTMNKSGVNKVLGLFKKFEKDGTERKVMNTRSTSNIERQGKDCISNYKERPKSGGFVSRLRHNSSLLLQKKETSQNQDTLKNENQNNKKKNDESHLQPQEVVCADCVQKQEQETIKHCLATTAVSVPVDFLPPPPKYNNNKTDSKNCAKEKRKGLMLDFSKLDNTTTQIRRNDDKNLVENYNYCGNYNNNNPYSVGTHEINRNHLLAPSSDNIAYYSSDSRSPYDDCASSSTFLSPSEEPELSFDNWSVCSEDNFMIPPPSPSISRVSRGSQLSSPINYDTNHPESVIDRIKRRSFYCRFNEKKPKRQSNIVGPGARDYYRESAARLRSRPTEQINSPDNDDLQTTNDYLKSFKPVTTTYSDLRPPPAHTKSSTITSDYLKPRKSLNDIFPTSTLITKRYTDNDYLRPRTQTKDNGSYNYNSYNPKRRCSFTSNGVAPITSSAIDGYATLGRRTLRPYEHRSISLLDSSPQPSSISSTISSLKREQRQPTDLRNLSKSSSHYRNSSVSRSPTNI